MLQRHPPRAEEHDSKRDGATTVVETGMVGSMQELRIQTVTKNQDFDERIRALQSRLACVDMARGVEAADREAQLKRIRESVAADIEGVDGTLSAAIQSTHDELELRGVEPIRVDLASLVKVEQATYRVEVRHREEELSGPLVRRMLSERQAFEIDNTKVRAREKRLVGRFEAWEAATVLRHQEEAEDRFERFCALREAIAEAMAREDRSEEELQVWLANSLLATSSKIAGVRDARVAGDEFSLATMADSMQTIQQSVLENFGAEPDGEDDDEDEDSAAEELDAAVSGPADAETESRGEQHA